MAAPGPTALILDWGGVLTVPMEGAFRQWAGTEGVDHGHYRDVMRQWLAGPPEPADVSPVHQLERGEVAVSDFEQELSRELARRGSPVAATGLVDRMLAGLDRLQDDMVGVVRRARSAGLRTALLSNSWGEGHYPEALWDNLFDVVVVSGRVGMRKPERRIFEYTARLLGVPAGQCVLVDDMVRNVHAAVGAGMIAVHHTDYELTVLELEAIFELPLR